MAPCAVCKQWLKKYSDTEYINRYDLDWLKIHYAVLLYANLSV